FHVGILLFPVWIFPVSTYFQDESPRLSSASYRSGGCENPPSEIPYPLGNPIPPSRSHPDSGSALHSILPFRIRNRLPHPHTGQSFHPLPRRSAAKSPCLPFPPYSLPAPSPPGWNRPSHTPECDRSRHGSQSPGLLHGVLPYKNHTSPFLPEDIPSGRIPFLPWTP